MHYPLLLGVLCLLSSDYLSSFSLNSPCHLIRSSRSHKEHHTNISFNPAAEAKPSNHVHGSEERFWPYESWESPLRGQRNAAVGRGKGGSSGSSQHKSLSTSVDFEDILRQWNDTSARRSTSQEKYNQSHPFPIRIVGIFVADSELPYTLELAKPSIDIAIEKAKKLYPLTKWEDAVFRNGSNRCTANLAGVFAAEEFYLRRVTVFIGPSCGLALDPVARMAAHWRIPVISSGGPHVQFSNKEIFSTLTRLSFSLTNMGSFVNKIFHLFNWTHVSIIVQEKPSPRLIPLVKEAIVDAFDSTENVTIDMHEISRSLAKTNLRNLLLECAKESRVILVLTSGDTLRKIMLSAFDLGMGEGSYVFITVELFKHANSFGNFDWFVAGDSRNEDIKRMYESLFLLTVHVPETETYDTFVEDVIHKSRNEFNTSFSSKDVNVILAGFHDSILMYGQAVTDTILDGDDPLDGIEVTRRIWNRTFTDYLSGDIFINANGDKETDYTLMDFNPDALEMRPVVTYSGRENRIIWFNMSAIHWPGAWIPSSNAAVCQEDIVDLYCNDKYEPAFPFTDVIVVIVIICLIGCGVVVYILRKVRLESELTSLWWKVRWNEIIFIPNQCDRSLEPTTTNAANKPSLFSNFVQNVAIEHQGLEDKSGVITSFSSIKESPKSTSSAPQSQRPESHNFFTRFADPHRHTQILNSAQSQSMPESSREKMGTESNNSSGRAVKPHIRINDYFALPTYLHNFSANRATNRAAGDFTNAKSTGEAHECKTMSSSTSASPSKCTTITVSHGSSGPRCTGTSASGNNLCSLPHITREQKQISSESLALIPNKGIYKGSKVFVKHLNIKHFTVNREILLELKQMKDLAHENLIRFVGICAEDQHISILTEYCEKSNLRDLLDNEGIRIDWPFRYSLINDIVEGMHFIHESSLNYHGSLKSTNCVIDSRLVVKLTDFGLKTLRNLSKQNSGPVQYKSLLWTAPEHLRQRKPDMQGSQKGDVYSFAIVLQEIITRSGPFETVKVVGGDGKFSVVSLDPQFIIQQLKLGGTTPYRPNVDQNECLPELIELLTQCWDENPANRPTFQSIKSTIGKIAKDFVGGSGNSFLENLLLRLEQYANDLEILVEQKTSAFFEEKRKCEELLYELLPRTVADQLKRGTQVKPESYQCVTIFFSDIVKFTQLAAESTPMETVDFLNDLYTLFDSIISSYDVYKVETVGDAYLVVSGLPVRNGNEHARQIARMSLELLYRIKQFKIKHLPEREVKLRIGIHSGPCAAGVIGLKMPRYCLFGDTVNTASRMESHGEPNKIHTSETTKHILEKFGTFHLTFRGDIYLKGKGIVRTYWLESEQSTNLVNRYRFLNKVSDSQDMPFEADNHRSIPSSKQIEQLHSQLSDESYTESFGLASANRGESIEVETLVSVDRETISDQFAEQKTSLLAEKCILAKSSST